MRARCGCVTTTKDSIHVPEKRQDEIFICETRLLSAARKLEKNETSRSYNSVWALSFYNRFRTVRLGVGRWHGERSYRLANTANIDRDSQHSHQQRPHHPVLYFSRL